MPSVLLVPDLPLDRWAAMDKYRSRADPRFHGPARLRSPRGLRPLVDAARRSVAPGAAGAAARPAAVGGALLLLSLAREARGETHRRRPRARSQLRAHDRDGGAPA